MRRTNSTTYLERMNNGAWRVTVGVPKEAQKVLGKTRLKRSLQTHSLAEANRLKHAVVGEFMEAIEAAKNGNLKHSNPPPNATEGATKDDLKALALELRSMIQSLPAGTKREIEVDGVYILADQIRGDPIGEDTDTDEPIYDRNKEIRAGEFVKVALGMETPINVPLVKFHSEGKWLARTKTDSERAIRYLEEWCSKEGVQLTIESISRRIAGRFVSDMKASAERHLTNKTINKYLTCLSSYWSWLEKRGYIDHDTNPWKGQFLPKEAPKEDEQERPFTDEEISKLLNGKPRQPYINHVMMIGALTGARIDAIVSLKAKDITPEGCFRFKPQKQEKGSRLVPIHSALKDTVAALMKGKKPEDDLFPECPPVAPGVPQERSMPAVKAFGYYRQKLGVTDKVAGKRRDRVNFHSFRRWFITKAYQAGQAEIVVQTVVGHKPQSVGGAVYLGGLTHEQLRACVEAVKLPV